MADRAASELMERAAAMAGECEATYHGCAQCVLLAIQRAVDLESEDTFRAATGLSAGIGCLGMTCGALTGAVLALGLAVGRATSDLGTGSKVHWDNYRLVKSLVQQFRAKYGEDLSCHAIQKQTLGRSFDLWDPVDQVAFKELGARETGCASVVGDGASWAVDLILHHQSESL